MSLFRRERRSPKPEPAPPPPPSPADEFQTLWQNQGRQRQQFFTLALLALGALILVLLAYVRLATASRFVPFLYVVDRSGEVLALGSAHPLPADTDTIVYQSLATFVTGVRAVYRDPVAQRAALQAAYGYLPSNNPEATSPNFLSAYLSTNDPRTLAQQFTRTTEIAAVIKLPARTPNSSKTNTATWKVSWAEITYPVGGVGARTRSDWEAFLLVRVTPKRVVEAYDPNPFGVYVDQITWSRLTPERAF
jgi:type IV secretion system protein VirB5